MTLVADIAADFLLFDGLEAVTLRVPADEVGSAATVTYALRRSIHRREVEVSGGKYTMQDSAWHFLVSAGTPVIGGTITESDGVIWTILETQKQSLDKRWRCVCRKLEVSGGYDRLVTIEEATWAKGASGAQTATWSTVVAGVVARIQEQLGEVTTDDGQKIMRRSYRISLNVAQTLTQSHRIVAADGEVYKIEAVEPATIGTSQVVRAIKDPFTEIG